MLSRPKLMTILYVGWGVLISAICALEIYYDWTRISNLAALEAKTHLSLTLSVRKLVSDLGGVYASTDAVSPNPYLKVPNRDLTLSDGKTLTLVNPAYFMRLVFQTHAKGEGFPVMNRLTSEKLLNPINAPDAWEDAALKEFHHGVSQKTELVYIGGEPFFRLIKPFVTQESCLKCHGHQGYKPGDIRGASSFYIPLKDHFAAYKDSVILTLLSYAVILAVGYLLLFVFSRRLNRYENRLLETAQRFKLLSESTLQWEFWLDNDGALLFMSPSAEAITGYSVDEFMADKALLERRLHESEKALAHPLIALYDQNDRSKDFVDFRFKHKQDHWVWLQMQRSSIRFNNEPKGWRFSCRDITQLKKVEEEQRLLEEQLLQTQKLEALGRFVGGVAHDFNNMLTAIIGNAVELSKILPAGSKDQQLATRIQGVAEKSAQLTRSLLTFSRKQQATFKAIELNQAVRSFVSVLERLIGENIRLTLELPETALWVSADELQLQQVFMNLATNARDAMPSGGSLLISLDLVKTSASSFWAEALPGLDSCVRVRVKDTGHGIAKAQLAKIFDPFFTTKAQDKGTGLGLPIVHGIVRKHGGAVFVDSDTDRGAEFTILLAAIPAPVSNTTVSKLQTSPAPALQQQPLQKRILIVEDEEAIRDVLMVLLADVAKDLVLAENGVAAVKIAKDLAEKGLFIDLLLTDVQMPDKNGVEAWKEIAPLHKSADVLFMTGYTEESLTDIKIPEHQAEVIQKPFDPDTIISRIRSILSRKA